MNFNPDRKNSVNITGYLSTDRFKLNNDTTYNYGNDNLNLKWKHIFNNKVFTTVTAGYDHYQYGISSSEDSINSFKLNFDLAQVHARVALTYNASNAHSLEFGVNSIYYMINPGEYQPSSKASLIRPLKIQDEQGLESAVYLGDKYSISPDLSLSAGIRYSMFSFL
ncbi:MAG TPA: TonB-dependent receptor, partial [Flavitalea sp.]|nr:TonB-dependent receptor [Flavitalea sp.]